MVMWSPGLSALLRPGHSRWNLARASGLGFADTFLNFWLDSPPEKQGSVEHATPLGAILKEKNDRAMSTAWTLSWLWLSALIGSSKPQHLAHHSSSPVMNREFGLFVLRGVWSNWEAGYFSYLNEENLFVFVKYCLGLLQNPIRILLVISPPLREDPNHAGSQVLSFTQTSLLRGEDGIRLPLPHQNPTLNWLCTAGLFYPSPGDRRPMFPTLKMTELIRNAEVLESRHFRGMLPLKV